MDHWDAAQVKRMELGGNEQLRAWFAKCKTENSALEMKYRTKASTLYRCVSAGRAKPERRVAPSPFLPLRFGECFKCIFHVTVVAMSIFPPLMLAGSSPHPFSSAH